MKSNDCSFTFQDSESGDEAYVGVRVFSRSVGLAVSLRSNGDLQISIPASICAKLADCLKVACGRLTDAESGEESGTERAASPSSDIWYSVTIDDPDLTKSTSFRRLVSDATRFVSSTACKVADLEIVPFVPPKMEAINGRMPVLALDDLDRLVSSVTQIAWGKFFFYSTLRAAEEAVDPNSLVVGVPTSAFTICVLDNESYVVFTRSLPFVCELLSRDWPVDVTKDTLSRILSRQASTRPERGDEAC